MLNKIEKNDMNSPLFQPNFSIKFEKSQILA